jgi:hypothetical protein
MLKRILFFVALQSLIATGLAANSGLISLIMNSPAPECKNWKTIPLDQKNWTASYEGFGKIHFNDGVQLHPRSIASESGTHAALTVLNEPIQSESFLTRIRYKNISQLRKPASNSWEVFWLFFNYNEGNNKVNDKETNYFIFKPNGVELGKAWGETNQDFLLTHENPRLELGQEYDLILHRAKSQVDVYINNKLIMHYTDKNKKTLFDQKGSIGLYTEDAHVQISSVEICENFKTVQKIVQK